MLVAPGPGQNAPIALPRQPVEQLTGVPQTPLPAQVCIAVPLQRTAFGVHWDRAHQDSEPFEAQVVPEPHRNVAALGLSPGEV
ncbi:MAG: hypothetical protein H6Q89_4900 [Myxococcaceae bacterium]|nr:hypothetical protein [Myxococcaceae bacterium]